MNDILIVINTLTVMRSLNLDGRSILNLHEIICDF